MHLLCVLDQLLPEVGVGDADESLSSLPGGQALQVDHAVLRDHIVAQLGAGGEPTDVDRAVANLVVPEIPNGACLQLGIGGMPNTIGAMIAQSDLKDLSVHTEMYVDGFVDMAAAGKITGRNKALDKGRQVFAFAAGTQKLYDYMDRNPDVMGAPVDYTNDVHVISLIDNFISINNAIDMDLFGQVNAESAGIKHISGTGGQLDFAMGAYQSKGPWTDRRPWQSPAGRRCRRCA